ncbi:MAG: hypothetical protein J3K34DRAFT_438353 [Monoraphidium minutum]|nr:MAG: hypothetical protein J3K34DRAFT_438353 [Monoraphidium minutum]
MSSRQQQKQADIGSDACRSWGQGWPRKEHASVRWRSNEATGRCARVAPPAAARAQCLQRPANTPGSIHGAGKRWVPTDRTRRGRTPPVSGAPLRSLPRPRQSLSSAWRYRAHMRAHTSHMLGAGHWRRSGPRPGRQDSLRQGPGSGHESQRLVGLRSAALPVAGRWGSACPPVWPGAPPPAISLSSGLQRHRGGRCLALSVAWGAQTGSQREITRARRGSGALPVLQA